MQLSMTRDAVLGTYTSGPLCHSFRWLSIAVAVALALGAAPVHDKSDYTLTIVAKTGDVVDGKTLTGLGGPMINNRGVVTFGGSFSTGVGIFAKAQRQLERDATYLEERRRNRLALLVQTGDVIGGRTLTGLARPVINNRGEIVFLATFSGGSGIFTPSNLLVRTGDAIGGKTLTEVGNPTINERGTVLFRGTFLNGFGLFTPTSLLVKTGDVIGGKTLTILGANPVINNRETVAFFGFSGGSDPDIFTLSRVVAKTGDIIDGKMMSIWFAVAINDRGTLVFPGRYVGGEGIFTPSNLLVKTGDVIGGKTLTSVGRSNTLGVSNRGEVAFLGAFAGGAGIFTESRLVAKTGDVIGGKNIELVFSPLINDHGDIVFTVTFRDGTSAVILAEPH